MKKSKDSKLNIPTNNEVITKPDSKLHKRQFNQASFDDVDMKSKNRTLQLFRSLGHKVELNPNPFEVDIIAYNDDGTIKGYIEVECRKSFSDILLKYETVHIPARKLKFFTLEKPTTYVCWSHDLNQYYIVKGSIIRDCPIEKTIIKGTNFYDNLFVVPKDKVKFYKFDVPIPAYT